MSIRAFAPAALPKRLSGHANTLNQFAGQSTEPTNPLSAKAKAPDRIFPTEQKGAKENENKHKVSGSAAQQRLHQSRLPA
jgi:hypothetical protein